MLLLSFHYIGWYVLLVYQKIFCWPRICWKTNLELLCNVLLSINNYIYPSGFPQRRFGTLIKCSRFFLRYVLSFIESPYDWNKNVSFVIFHLIHCCPKFSFATILFILWVSSISVFAPSRCFWTLRFLKTCLSHYLCYFNLWLMIMQCFVCEYTT